MERKITGFHQDGEQHWVADLDCGHTQHVRHDPPWQNREWTQTIKGREAMLGHCMNCRLCDEEQA